MRTTLAATAAALLFAVPAQGAPELSMPNMNDAKVGWSEAVLVMQARHSSAVLAFFAGRHHWMLMPNQAQCRGIIGQDLGYCHTARQQVRLQSWLLGVSERRLSVLRAREARALEAARQRELIETDPIAAIRYVFGEYADQAITVSRCETGGTFSVYATNGQYHGLFQMGSHERATYGDSYTPLGQTEAAYRYFEDAGGWGPWSCRPY